MSPTQNSERIETNERKTMPLFEVVVLEKPTKKSAEDGGMERLVFGPKAIVARDAQSAAIGAVMSGEMAKDVDLTRTDVLVRPFSQ